MTAPETAAVDQRLPDAEAVVDAFRQSDRTWCDGHDTVRTLFRLLYPAYRVEYSYVPDDGGVLPWADGERADGVALIDGLWADNDDFLAYFAEGSATPSVVRTAAAYDGDSQPPTAVVEFHGDERQARSVLSKHADYYRERAADAGDGGADLLDQFRETYGFDDAVTPSNFDGVERIERLYLPFWIVELTAPGTDELCYVAVRPEEGQRAEEFTSFRRISELVAGRQSFLQSNSAWLGGEMVTFDDETPSDAPPASRAATEPAATDAETPAPDVAQPDGVEHLDAETMVTPAPDRGFADVGGMTELKETLQRKVLDPLSNPERFDAYGLSTVNGVLLHGPPGCGKTHLAGALAGELGRSFVEVRPADLTSKWMGEPAQKVADLFAIARANQPCLVFLDELDAITMARDQGSSNQSEQQMVNQLLTELEAVADEDVVVFGATNHLDDIDDAIRRSGRFDERVEVPPPDADARREILQVHLAGRPTAEDVSLSATVERTAGYAASDLALLVDEAARAALRAESVVTEQHLLDAAGETETSIDDWLGQYPFVASETDGTGQIVQPADVEHLQARSLIERTVKRDFGDVGGMADLKTTLDEKVLDPLRDPERYAEYGLDTVSGVLLYGPPGCGKTYLTRALAGELDHFFLPVSPAELTAEVMGEPAQRVADLFAIARANQPCIVFLDEIDAVAAGRSGQGNQSQQQMVNQLLTELESIDGEDVVVVGATNLIEDVDGAIRRSGRFDERIEVPPPTADARREILSIHLDDRPTADGIEWARLVDATEGYAASDLERIADEAAHRALRADADVTTDHLLDAVEGTESSLRHWDDGERYEESEETSNLGYYA